MAATNKKPSNRVPESHVQHIRDDKGNRVDIVKNAWRKATHTKQAFLTEYDVEVKEAEDGKKKQKRKETRSVYRWVRVEGTPSLKQWLRTAKDAPLFAAQKWFANKAAKTTKPQLCIGRTRGGSKKK